MIGWIDHFHGVAQVAKWTGSTWAATTVGKGTAFSSYQEVLSLDIASSTEARVVWKNASKGVKIMATSYR